MKNIGSSEFRITRRAISLTRAQFHLRRWPAERMLRLHHKLLEGSCPNCTNLAREFEVSRKTIRRDIEYMRDHFDAPIAYDPKRQAFYYSHPFPNFPGEPCVSDEEALALLVAYKAMAQYRGTPFGQALAGTANRLIGAGSTRLCASHGPVSFRPLAPEYVDTEIFELLRTAVTGRRALQFTYRKPGEPDPELRIVHPYHITCADNGWYLIAFDVNRTSIRKFALGRVTHPRFTGACFLAPTDFDPEQHLRGSFNVMTGEGDFHIAIEFDAWATDVLRGRQLHPTQSIDQLPGGASRVTMRLSCLEEIERWVLSWGLHANAVAPDELVHRLTATARLLCARYTARAGVGV